MIPGMLRQHDDRLFKAIPSKDIQLAMSIEFDNMVPKGVYERIICLFLNRSGCIEGSKAPLVFVDITRFFFQEAMVYLIPDGQVFRIVIDEGWSKWITDICDLANHCIQVLSSFFHEDTFNGRLLLHSRLDQEMMSEFHAVKNALDRGKPKVFDSKNISSISTNEFRKFFPLQ